MTTAAASCITKAEERIRDMIANTTAFQAWIGAADATAAKSSIYYSAMPYPVGNDTSPLAYNQALRPFALLWTETYKLDYTYDNSGVICARFEQDIPQSAWADPGEAERLFLNTLGAILLSGDVANPGLQELSITQQYAAINQMDVMDIISTSEEQYGTYGHAIQATVQITWGVAR